MSWFSFPKHCFVQLTKEKAISFGIERRVRVFYVTNAHPSSDEKYIYYVKSKDNRKFHIVSSDIVGTIL